MSKFLSSLCFRRGDGFWMYVWKILVLIVTVTVAFIGVLVFWQFCRYKVYYGWLRPALSDKVSGSVYLSDRIRMDYMLYSNGVRLYDKEQDKVVMKGLASVFVLNLPQGFPGGAFQLELYDIYELISLKQEVYASLRGAVLRLHVEAQEL